MFDTIAPRYELVNRLITFGLDHRWRTATLDRLALPSGSHLLDLAAGTGDFTRLATDRGMTVVSADLSIGMLQAGRGTTRAVEADAAHMPFADATFDGLVCGYALRNFTDLAGAIAEMARVVRPGGRLAILEVAAPSSRLLRSGYSMWFDHCVPKIGGFLSDRDAYAYLPRSTAYLPETDDLCALFTNAGFSGVNHHLILGGLSQRITGTRRGDS